MNAELVNELVDRYGANEAASLAILQEIQQAFNYLPREALEQVADRLKVPCGYLYQIATFYRTFSLQPKGKHRVCVCLGTACHVHGGPHILEAFERELKLKAGESTPDGEFSLEATACLGACAQAPFVRVNDEPLTQMAPARVHEVVGELRAGAKGGR